MGAKKDVFPKICIVDTNVPKIANLAHGMGSGEDIPEECILACLEAVESVIKNRGLVLDEDEEIYNEYRRQLNLKGQPGVGDQFLKWVNDHRWGLPDTQRVRITKDGDTYKEFPSHEGLKTFDISDRKFVAVANAHPEHPPILQAVDSKWWDWKTALEESGLTPLFLCPEYIQNKWQKKMEKK